MSTFKLSNLTIGYSALFSLFSIGDAWSTHFARRAGFGQEFNPAMQDDLGGMADLKFWGINLTALVITSVMLEWALRHRAQVNPRYLEKPFLATFNWFYLNPFSARNRSKAPLHWMAMAIGFICIKPFAILNNLNIAQGRSGFLDGAVHWLAQYLQGVPLYMAAISIVTLPLWMGCLYIVAHLLKDKSAPLTNRVAR